jgi:putative NIF3 family GTP cyclohydrolase 1 type 2
LPLTDLAEKLDDWLGSSSHLINEPDAPIENVGIVSGGGADAVQACATEGYDCLITGEMEHSQYYPAIELGISVVAAGHYRTETPGVKAVMQWVRERYDVECSFIDLPTGL